MEYAPYCPPVSEKEMPLIEEPILEEQIEEIPEFRARAEANAHEVRDMVNQATVQYSNRSVSFSHYAKPGKVSKRNTFRRKSMDIIRKKKSDDLGSKEFRTALEQDASHEIHPGWDSIRRLAGVLG